MTTNLAAVADKTFDYVIAGGGVRYHILGSLRQRVDPSGHRILCSIDSGTHTRQPFDRGPVHLSSRPGGRRTECRGLEDCRPRPIRSDVRRSKGALPSQFLSHVVGLEC